MDQIKIGIFIAERRKAVGLTHMQLAEKLCVSDRAVSKWENGKAMPDSSIMLQLCSLLNITVNDLLNGEMVTVENYNEEMEKKLVEIVRQKEESDKRLLNVEVVIGLSVFTLFFILIMLAGLAPIETWARITIIIVSFTIMLITCFFLIRIEQTAGYYECKHCGYRYVPTYKEVNLSMHIGRTRYMKCPNCGKKSWQKKVIGKKKID